MIFLHRIVRNVKARRRFMGRCVCGESWQASGIPPDLTFSHTNQAFFSFLHSSISTLLCLFSLFSRFLFLLTHSHSHTVHALFLLCYPMAWRLKRGQAWLLLARYQEIPDDDSPHSCQDSFMKHETINTFRDKNLWVTLSFVLFSEKLLVSAVISHVLVYSSSTMWNNPDAVPTIRLCLVLPRERLAK